MLRSYSILQIFQIFVNIIWRWFYDILHLFFSWPLYAVHAYALALINFVSRHCTLLSACHQTFLILDRNKTLFVVAPVSSFYRLFSSRQTYKLYTSRYEVLMPIWIHDTDNWSTYWNRFLFVLRNIYIRVLWLRNWEPLLFFVGYKGRVNSWSRAHKTVGLY